MNISNVGVEEDSRGGQAVAERNGAGGGGAESRGAFGEWVALLG